MTDHIDTPGDARQNINDAIIAGQFTRALLLANELRKARHTLDSAEIADAAFNAWTDFTTCDVDIPESIGADVLTRLAEFVAERTAFDMADTLFGDHPAEVCLHDGRKVKWMPDDNLLLLTYPVAVIGRTTTLNTLVLVRDRVLDRAL